MKQKTLERTYWKIPQVEIFFYQFHFCNYFSKYNPEFIRELENDLMPLHLDIFGKHEQISSTLSEYNWMLTPAISKKDYLAFAEHIETKIKVFGYDLINQKGYSFKKLKINTDNLLDKIISIIERHNLFFGNEVGNIPDWLIHSILCQIEAGIPYLITPLRQIVFELPFEMLRKLWSELPKEDIVLIMYNQENYLRKLGIFNLYKPQFESRKVFLETYLLKTLPPPPFFELRPYNIYEDINHYEKTAVTAFKQHIKNYTNRIKTAFRESKFKRNNKDDYSQTEWLVIWNKNQVTYLWEIFSYIPDFQKVSVNNDKAKRAAEDRLRKAFTKFRKYGLPVRPLKRKRKNSNQKNSANVSASKK